MASNTRGSSGVVAWAQQTRQRQGAKEWQDLGATTVCTRTCVSKYSGLPRREVPFTSISLASPSARPACASAVLLAHRVCSACGGHQSCVCRTRTQLPCMRRVLRRISGSGVAAARSPVGGWPASQAPELPARGGPACCSAEGPALLDSLNSPKSAPALLLGMGTPAGRGVAEADVVKAGNDVTQRFVQLLRAVYMGGKRQTKDKAYVTAQGSCPWRPVCALLTLCVLLQSGRPSGAAPRTSSPARSCDWPSTAARSRSRRSVRVTGDACHRSGVGHRSPAPFHVCRGPGVHRRRRLL
jgi:hypothetical protein